MSSIIPVSWWGCCCCLCSYFFLSFFLLNSLSPTHSFHSSFLLPFYYATIHFPLYLYYLFKERERGNFFLFFTRRNRQPLGLCSFTSSCCHEKKNFHSRAYPSSHEILHAERERAKNGNREEDDQVRVCTNLFSIRARHEHRERETGAENRKSSKAGIWRR